MATEPSYSSPWFAPVSSTVGPAPFFATISLVSLWLERYLLVMPSVTPLPGPTFGVPELGPTLLFLGLYLVCYALFARTFPMVSPRLEILNEFIRLGSMV